MKKYAIYCAILIVGLMLGWLVFADASNTDKDHDHHQTDLKEELWTCSMHPQIQQSEFGDCPICGMELIPVQTDDTKLSSNQFKLTENAMALANIQTSIVGNLNKKGQEITLSGKVSVNMDQIATQPAHFDGRIEKLFVTSVGEKVKKMQPVAEIYSSQLVKAQQELLIAFKMRQEQPKLFEAVKHKFSNWKIDESIVDEILKTGQIKSQFTIHSHVSGIVSQIDATVGSHIMEGKPIFKVSDLSTVWANFDVYEDQINTFYKGQNVLIATNANPNEKITGKVAFIDPVLDVKTRTVKLRVILNNTNNKFKPGMFVEGRIKIQDTMDSKSLSIPSSSVLWTGERSVVYIKTDPMNPIFEMRMVNLGKRTNDAYEVLSGLTLGDEIVTNGTFTVDAAAQLRGKLSMMNQNKIKPSPLSDVEIKRIMVEKPFKNQLNIIFDEYILLKDALVRDDSEDASQRAINMLKILSKVDVDTLKTNQGLAQWMKLETQITSASKLIAASNNLSEQRQHFILLSEHMSHAVQRFGIDKRVYKQFCAMADHDKGAYWLSNEEKILNPYFGKAMLNCGEISQIIE